MSSHDDVPDPDLEALAARLGNLPREARPARDLWPEIAARMDTRPAPARRRAAALLRLAAALLLFASGVAVGHVWGRSSAGAAPDVRTAGYPLAPAAEVQRAGTAYVAALAALRGERRTEVRVQGREVAFSTLLGAAHELSRLEPQDAAASQVLSTVSRVRQGTGRAVHF
jgi:hypothetical protein